MVNIILRIIRTHFYFVWMKDFPEILPKLDSCRESNIRWTKREGCFWETIMSLIPLKTCISVDLGYKMQGVATERWDSKRSDHKRPLHILNVVPLVFFWPQPCPGPVWKPCYGVGDFSLESFLSSACTDGTTTINR